MIQICIKVFCLQRHEQIKEPNVPAYLDDGEYALPDGLVWCLFFVELIEHIGECTQCIDAMDME